jgi:hypothetical protein
MLTAALANIGMLAKVDCQHIGGFLANQAVETDTLCMLFTQ